jgi:hypothetical protein
MIKKILGVLFIVIFSSCFCSAQQNNLLLATNWGSPIHGVQLSIGVANTNLTNNTTNIVFVRIKNSSTNVICIAEINPIYTPLFLINSSWKTYRLTPDIVHSGHYISIPVNFPPYNQKLAVGATFEGSIQVVISKDIPIGSYDLMGNQRFTITDNQNVFKLESNLLKVQIK